MGAGPPFLYSRARDAGSSLALISPRDGDRRFTSAITVTWRPRSAVTKSVGGVTVRARFSRSARIVRAVATRLLVSCMIRPSTPVGGVHLVENACTSATVRLMSIRALFGQSGQTPATLVNQGHAMPLTKRQREILDFLTSYSEQNGYAPSFEEIARQ